MSISVIVYCPQSPLLATRHLLHSLMQQQELTPEVILFHEQGVLLPTWLPDSWQKKEVPAQTPLSQIWNEGLATAQQEWITFVEPEVFYHPLHFATLHHYLRTANADSAYVHCQFLDRELYPLEVTVPTLSSAVFKSSVISEDLLIPLGAFVFKRSLLATDTWDTAFDYYLEEAFLGRWTENHTLEAIPVASVSAIPQRNRAVNPVARNEEFIRLYRHWLKTHSPDQLAPVAAYPEGSQDTLHALNAILQGLYNRGLTEEARLFAEQNAQALAASNRGGTVWFLPEGTEVSAVIRECWQNSAKKGENPVLIQFRTQRPTAPHPLQISRRYHHGMTEITLSHISPRDQELAFRHFSPEILKQVKPLIEQVEPVRAHFSSFQLVSVHMTQYLEELNIPVFYSFSDPADLQIRQWLREPETESHWLRIRPSEAENLNYLLQKFFERQAARIFVENSEDLHLLEKLGLNTHRVQVISSAAEIEQAYLTPLSSQASKAKIPSLRLMYHLLTGKHLGEHLSADSPYFEGCRQVLTLGSEEKNLLHNLHHHNIPALGLSHFLTNEAQDLSGLLLQGSLRNYLKSFDGLHSAYTLEQLTPRQLVQFLMDCNLALQKGGRLVIRLLNLETLDQPGFYFWLDENHQRPYPAPLLETLLKHCGFEVLEQRTTDNPWKDILLDSVLRFPFLPSAQVPILTRRLSEFWRQHDISLVPPENSRVLIAGPQIQQTWTRLRPHCQRLKGFSFSLSEITAKHKPGLPAQLHHTRDFVRTLTHIEADWDLILWQGVAETLTPSELMQALHVCVSKLAPGGQFWIQSLDYDQAPDLFWEGLLNRRPYPALATLLTQSGLTVLEQQTQEGVTTWHCQKQTHAPSVPTPLPDLPFRASAFLQQAALWQPTSLSDLQQAATEQTEALCLGEFLQACEPETMQTALQETFRLLTREGAFLFWMHKPDPHVWANNQISRPYHRFTLDKLLKEQGFALTHTEETSTHVFWIGRKLQRHQAPPHGKPLSVLWQGDFFNYHSLSLVNRHLADALCRRGEVDLQAMPFSNASFEPQPGEAFYPLQTRMQRPLLNQPDIVLRHHWPPDFEPPAQPGHWVMIQPWEFGSIPERWIFNMNKYVDQVWVPSQFVKDCYLESGLSPDKIKVVPNGVDTALYHPDAPPLILPTSKKFRFLFIGGGILRKGVDLLIKAFMETFTRSDDVCLVVKEFGAGTVYEGLNIAERLENCRAEYPEMPEILHLTEDLPLEEMPSLYTACDCLVHPYRGEGFGLPIAEAMSAQLPVIVTGFGAALDFCNPDNAYLIPAEKQLFGERQIDRVLATVDYPFWANPDFEALKLLLRHVWENRKEAARKAVRARETIVQQFSWDHAADIAASHLQALSTQPVFRFHRSQILGNALGEGFQAFHRSNYPLAIEKFEYALQIDPYQPDVAYNLGLAYLMHQHYEQALKYLSQSLREGECTADLCYAMGTALRHLGDSQTAEEFHQKARELEALLAGA